MANLLDSLDLDTAEALLEQERKNQSTKENEKEDRERSSSRHKKKKKHRSKSRSGSRKKKHSKKRSRSRSDSRKRKRSKDRKHKKDKERDRDRDDKDRSRSRHRDREEKEREAHEKARKEAEAAEQEEKRKAHLKAIEAQLEEAKRLAEEAKRDDLTILILQLSLKTTEYDIYSFFQSGNCGSIRDIRIIKDPRTGKSKGVAYVEFYTQESVVKAIAMNGRELNGHVVKVQPSQAEKNRAALAAKNYRQMKQSKTQGDGHQPGVLSMKVLVQGLTDSLSLMQEQDLRDLFSPFGDIDTVELPIDAYGNLKGFAFIQYRNPDDARAAIKKMNGFAIGGRQLKVSNVQPGMVQSLGEQQNLDLDEESGASYIHNAQSRALLMQKLLREDGGSMNQPANQGYGGMNPAISISSISMPVQTGPPESNYPTQYMLIPKLFDYHSVNLNEEPGFFIDLKEDVEGECSKYGQVDHVFVEQSPAGNIWIAFRDIKSAEAAKNALGRRFFQGQKMNPYFVSQATFNQYAGRG